jgi:CRISPR system Cascade subunit CasE
VGRVERKRSQLTFVSVLFEGRLRVTDPGKFRATLERGVGSAKAYGFGLLSIAPI